MTTMPSKALAGTTIASAIISKGIFLVVFMASLAVCSGQCDQSACLSPWGSPKSTPIILQMGNRLQVMRVYATVDSAEVIKFEAIRDGASRSFIAYPVGTRYFLMAERSNLDLSVPLAVEGCHPYPATGLSDYLDVLHYPVDNWLHISILLQERGIDA